MVFCGFPRHPFFIVGPRLYEEVLAARTARAWRRSQRGLWSKPPRDWIAPWDWRRRAREPGYRPIDHAHETLEACLASLRQRRGDAIAAASATSLDAVPVASGSCAIKGNIGRDGDRIYHVPGSDSYASTRIDPNRGERWFCSEDEARRAGWRAPRQVH